jgi:hypothetical protein
LSEGGREHWPVRFQVNIHLHTITAQSWTITNQLCKDMVTSGTMTIRTLRRYPQKWVWETNGVSARTIIVFRGPYPLVATASPFLSISDHGVLISSTTRAGFEATLANLDPAAPSPPQRQGPTLPQGPEFGGTIALLGCHHSRGGGMSNAPMSVPPALPWSWRRCRG